MVGIDTVATALTFCWAGAVFLLAILFEIQHRRLKDKLEMLKRAKTTRWRVKCFSIDWEDGRSRRKIMAARGIFVVFIWISSLYASFFAIWILGTFGYAIFIPFLGLPIFLDNALDMYFYSRKVRKEPLEKLQDKDQKYIEYAVEILAKRRISYSILGFVYFVVALFIPQFFNLLPFVIAAYIRPAFFLSEKLIPIGLLVVVLFIALPMVLLIKYKWVILQVKRLTEWIRSKRRRSES